MWRDGTSSLLFEPLEFLEKLAAAIIPRPATNVVLYHDVLAPQARRRAQVVTYGRPAPDLTAHAGDAAASPRGAGTSGARGRGPR